MRALTIKQPWIDLLIDGTKRYETRTWTTSYRGLVALHASKRADKGAVDLWHHSQQCGVILAVAELVEVHRPGAIIDDGIRTYQEQDRHFWEFTSIRRLAKPFAVKGRQQLWIPDRALVRRIRKSL